MPAVIAAFPDGEDDLDVEVPVLPALLSVPAGVVPVGVVAPPVVGDDPAGVAVATLEPEAVPFKQLVLPPD